MSGGPINLESVLGSRATVTIAAAETEAEIAHRLELEKDAARHDHLKSMILFFVIVLSVLSVGLLCVYEIVLDVAASQDTRRWAQTTLSSLFAGSISFLLGQSTARKAR